MTYEDLELAVAQIIAGKDDAWVDIPDEFQCIYRDQAEDVIRKLVELGAMVEPEDMPPSAA